MRKMKRRLKFNSACELESKMARKITLETSASLKINTGNYETVDVSKTLIMEIEFETPDELVEKSRKADNCVAALLRAEADGMLEQLGRKRIMKVNGVDTPVEIFKSYVK